MDKYLLKKRFICEHQVVPRLDLETIYKLHRPAGEVSVLYSFSNLDEKCLYTVVESPDRFSVESFFTGMKVPCDSIMEVEVQGEGTDSIQDLRIRKAA